MKSSNSPNPRRLVVGSRNLVKTNAVLSALQRMLPEQEFTATSVAANSRVSEQPLGDAETRQGALHRAADARRLAPDADLWAGVEGGIQEIESQMYAMAWIAILTANQQSLARSAAFPLPPAVMALIRSGKELGEADDIVFQRTESKRNLGAVGLLTDGLIDRTELYCHAAILALIPLKHDQLFRA